MGCKLRVLLAAAAGKLLHISVRCMGKCRSIFQLAAGRKRDIRCVSLCDSELHMKQKLLVTSCADCTQGPDVRTSFLCLH